MIFPFWTNPDTYLHFFLKMVTWNTLGFLLGLSSIPYLAWFSLIQFDSLMPFMYVVGVLSQQYTETH